MFDLPDSSPLTDAAELKRALEASVRRRIELPAGREAVRVAMSAWPDGQRLEVDVSGGRLDVPSDPKQLRQRATGELRPPVIVADRRPGPRFDVFEVHGEPVEVGTMHCRLRLTGRGVQFDFGHDEDGSLVMAPAGGEGNLVASVPKSQLIDFVRRQAIDAAAEKGVVLEEVNAELSAPQPRSLAVNGTLRGRKKLGFLSAAFTMDFTARLELDDELVGHVRELDLRGQGLVMDTLLGLLRPKLAQIKARPVPLRDLLGAFVPAALGLRAIAIRVDEDVVLTAEFGHAIGEGRA